MHRAWPKSVLIAQEATQMALLFAPTRAGFLALLLCIASCPLPAAEAPAEPTHRLALFPLRCSDVSPAVGRSVFLTLHSELPLYGEFEVVERERVADLLREQKLQESGLVDDETAGRFGKLLGASHALLGEILSVAGKCKIALRLVEVETAKVVMAVEKPVPEIEGIDETAGQALKDLMEGGARHKASSELNAERKARCAFDGNRATSWMAAADGTYGWLEVWYTHPRLFREALLYAKPGEAGQGVPKRFSLSYWDGKEWRTLREVMGNSRAEWRGRFPPTSSSRWRLEVTAVIGGTGPVTVTELVLK